MQNNVNVCLLMSGHWHRQGSGQLLGLSPLLPWQVVNHLKSVQHTHIHTHTVLVFFNSRQLFSPKSGQWQYPWFCSFLCVSKSPAAEPRPSFDIFSPTVFASMKDIHKGLARRLRGGAYPHQRVTPSSPPSPGSCPRTWATRSRRLTPPRTRRHTRTRRWLSWSSTCITDTWER